MTTVTPVRLPATAADVKASLRSRHKNYGSRTEWVFFEELRTGTGYAWGSEQFIDAWALNSWPSKGFLRIAYEVKVSRADFLKEIRKPSKRQMAMLVSNQFYFAAPAGLIRPEELPAESGLIEVADWGSGSWESRETVPAPRRETAPPSWGFFASLARRVAREEV